MIVTVELRIVTDFHSLYQINARYGLNKADPKQQQEQKQSANQGSGGGGVLV